MPLRNLLGIVTACLCLHNVCIIENDEFSLDRVKEVEKELQTKANMSLGKMQQVDMFNSQESLSREMKELQKANPEAEETPFIKSGEEKEIEKENGACEETKKSNMRR
jgi:hypothetical protein